MTTASERIYGMHANTQREIELYQFVAQPDFILTIDPAARRVLVEGPITGRMRHDAVNPRNGVENQFAGYFAPSDTQIEIQETRPGNPDRFRATLTGNAYQAVMTGQEASLEKDASGRRAKFLGEVMAQRAYEAVNKPEFTIAELPGLNGGTVTINGPVLERARFGMPSYMSEYFGDNGVNVTEENGHFTATLTGAAYTTYVKGQAAYEASKPVAIGH